jgi:exopolysaccharide biosynthesis polyprenyl glycosylphosphotransferase
VREQIAVGERGSAAARPREFRVGGTTGAAPAGDAWVRHYLHNTITIDVLSALLAGSLALHSLFDAHGHVRVLYLALTAALPAAWLCVVALAGGYQVRFFGAGADEFRRVFNAGFGLTAAVAVGSYVTGIPVSREYLLAAVPGTAGLDVVARYALRKRLHHQRISDGGCMRRAIAVGHPADVAHLAAELRREPHHGLAVVGACLAGHDPFLPEEVAGVPVHGGLDDIAAAVRASGADTVAVLACPGMNGVRLRQLAWELEKTGTDLCLAPALLDVAGPRTSIRPAAGLPLLYVDHPDLSGIRQVIKGVFDRVVAGLALAVLSPLFLAIAVAVKLEDGGPVFFRQARVGKDGHLFQLYKFRTMVPDAEQRKAGLVALNEGSGVLFKIRNDPRVTRRGAWLRRWSLDELPQLLNVVAGQMSLVGPRPALPEEAAAYGEYVRRRLAVRPGLTGLWQIHGRSDLPWEEAVRLDLRYVENWSFALDLLILWKTWPAVIRGAGAY